jgi:sugar-phosphatase
MAQPVNVFDFECAAVLVDNDGVLVDSSPSILRAFRRWSDRYGLDGDAVYRELHGRRAIDVASAALQGENLVDAARLLDQFELEDARTVRALPGALAFLQQLNGDWTLVSSGPRSLVEARLTAAGLPRPRHLVTAESVTRGKPAPDAYLRAAHINSVPPGECVVLEDSQAGIEAAISAGCRVIQVGASVGVAGAVASVDDLRGIAVDVSVSGFHLFAATEIPDGDEEPRSR